MAIVRYERGSGRSIQPQCIYLSLRHTYGHLWTRQYHSTALEVGCVNLILSSYERSDQCERVSREAYPPGSGNEQSFLDTKQDCEATVTVTVSNHSSPSTAVSPSPVEFENLMPYLVKVAVVSLGTSEVERCLTVHEPTLNVSLEPCAR
jgi:hypothetical protein